MRMGSLLRSAIDPIDAPIPERLSRTMKKESEIFLREGLRSLAKGGDVGAIIPGVIGGAFGAMVLTHIAMQVV